MQARPAVVQGTLGAGQRKAVNDFTFRQRRRRILGNRFSAT
jgi:hypothetical protein